MKKLSLLIAAIILTIAAFGCTGRQTDTMKKIRLNEVTHSIFYAPLYVALEKGYFKEYGLDIELTNGGGADKSMTAILSGSADIGLMGPEAAMYVYLNGKENYPKIFAQLTKRDGSFLISRTREPDFDYTALTGKEIIAGRKGGVPAMTLEYLLKQKGYEDKKNITLNYDIQFNLTAAAFEGGTGDYCTLFEPTASEFERANKGYVVAAIGKDSGEVPYTAFMALNSYIKNNEQTVKNFLRAVYKGIDFLKDATDEEIVLALKGQFPSTDDDIIASAINRYKECDAWTENMTMEQQSFTRLKDIMTNAGELERDVPFEQLIDTNYSNIIYREMFDK